MSSTLPAARGGFFVERPEWCRPRSSCSTTPYAREVTEYQVTRWRELPSMVAARAGDEVVKAQLAARFQEAIDEAAMRLGDTGADDYLLGWDRTPWTAADGTPAEVVDRVTTELDDEWPADRVAAYLDGLGR
jgi:hypothetical protein